MKNRNRLVLVHELPKRLRFKLPLLSDPLVEVTAVEAEVAALEGIKEVRINPYARSLVVEYDSRPEVKATLTRRLSSLSREMFLHPAPSLPEKPMDLSQLISTALVLVGLPFLSRSLQAVVTFASIIPLLVKGMYALVTQGIKVEVLDATAVSVAALRGDYFTANATYFLLKAGSYLQYTTERRSDRLLRHLLKPDLGQAWVERQGVLQQLPAKEILTGDMVMVGAGDLIPIDGKVVEGTALVNQASLTGESLPVKKEQGDPVISGTAVQEGRIKIRAEQVGDTTTTARIAQFIEESLHTKSNTQKLADTLADRRVYVTLGLGGLIFALTRDLRRLASVFLVDYSCAIKLSTPVAFKSSLYQAATHGILVKGSQAIENLASADTFVFDKTGTLTQGRLEITEVIPLQAGWSEERLLALAASAEEHATHPLAEAVTRGAKKQALHHIDHTEVDFIVAHGLRTHVNDHRVLVGSRHFLEEHEQVSFAGYDCLLSDLEAQGKEVLCVARETTPLGLIALRAQFREEAAETLNRLKALGVQSLVMSTGDRRSKALLLAKQLSIDEVYAEMRPEEKAEIVKRLRGQGRKVAYVGDGVNDAPALISADVGVAMPHGADIARLTADINLLEDRLSAVAEARELAQRTMQLIQTSFQLAIGINSVVLLGASLGWLSPLAAALLHNGVTIGILVNTLAGASMAEKHPQER